MHFSSSEVAIRIYTFHTIEAMFVKNKPLERDRRSDCAFNMKQDSEPSPQTQKRGLKKTKAPIKRVASNTSNTSNTPSPSKAPKTLKTPKAPKAPKALKAPLDASMQQWRYVPESDSWEVIDHRSSIK